MSDPIGLKTIYDLLGCNFIIPCYQRGYRWTRQQVEDLLQDICDFTDRTKEPGEFYCLQPVVVKLCDKEMNLQYDHDSQCENINEWYEVIDGQQRITTLYIILRYLENYLGEETLESEYGREKFVIKYETRNTHHFLENITDKYSEQDNPIDCEYIYNAYQSIHNWFSKQKQPKPTRDRILNTLLEADTTKNTIQVIWYELPAQSLPNETNRTDTIDTFTRLNIGKIPLTNAELVKALFLQKRNFKDAETDLRQIEIAKEWDQMENTLQDKRFWAFLNKDLNESPVRIEFIFDTIYQIEKRKSEKQKTKATEAIDPDQEFGTDQYATFRFFSKKFANNSRPEIVLTVWEEVKSFFATFKDWYEDNRWYHYIGYLIWEGSNSILDIYEKYTNSLKSEFITALKGMVKESLIKKVSYTEENGVYLFTNTYEDTNKSTLRALFLLYNIEFILRKNAQYYRFPFDLFKREKWDIEHISSLTDNQLKDVKAQEQWLEIALDSLQESERAEYEANTNIKEGSFEDKRAWITHYVGEDRIDESLKNSIGNLTLLNATINRSYGNNIFQAKRNAIVERDKDGTFIPICTKNVFLKYHTGGNNLRWNEKDILNSMNHIVNILKDYITDLTQHE